MRSFGQDSSRMLLQSFLKTPCSLCDRSTAQILCPSCHRQLQACQLSSHFSPEGDLPIFAWGAYRGPLKRAIQAVKYEGCRDVAVLLGQQLGWAWQVERAGLGLDPTVRAPHVIPIPLHRHRQQQRGYNQAALIARGFAQITRMPCLMQGLRSVRDTAAQHSLTPAARAQNLAQAFCLGPDYPIKQWLGLGTIPPHRSSVLLIDDIYTTGTTANAAAAILTQHHIQVLGILTVARAIQGRSEKTGVAV